MAAIINILRGLVADISSYTPLVGQLLYGTDDQSVRVGDGAKLGGWPIGGRRVISDSGASHTITAAESGALLVLTGAAATAVSVPNAASANFDDGHWISVLATNGTVTLDASPATINGQATLTLRRYQQADLYSDGTNWFAMIGNASYSTANSILVGSAVALTTATPANVTSIVLGAGKWDVYGSIWSTRQVTTNVTMLHGWVSSASASPPSDEANDGGAYKWVGSYTNNIDFGFPFGPRRYSFSTDTTVYLSVESIFSGGTNGAYGHIRGDWVGL